MPRVILFGYHVQYGILVRMLFSLEFPGCPLTFDLWMN